MGFRDILPFGDDTDTETTRSARAADYDPEVDINLDDVTPEQLAGAEDAPVTSEHQYRDDDTPWPYDFKPMPGRDGRVMRDGHEFKVYRDPDEETRVPNPETVFCGAWPRAMVENHRHRPDQPVFLGIDSYANEVALPKAETFRHLLALGQTGGGKTTVFESYASQIGMSGHGFVAVDPGGEAAVNMIRQLPQERIDNGDVVLLDVGADYTDRRIGFNLLDTYNDPGDDGFQNELENRVADILPLMEADQYQRMKGIAEHVLRGLIEADYSASENGQSTEFGEAVHEYFHEDDDSPSPEADENYTIQDMYHILSSQENREEWFQMVAELGMARLTTYARQLADLDDDDNKLEPLIRRLRSWMESENVRPVVSQRKTTISIPEVVKEGKVLIVKCNEAPDTVREIITGAISRMIWSVCMARPSAESEYIQRRLGGEDPDEIEITDQQEPFYLLLDEIHSLVGKDTKLVDMLAEARKKKLGLCLMTQQLNQLPSGDSGNHVQEKIVSNTGTTLAYHPGEDAKEQSAVASAFQGRDTDDIMVDPYHATVAITDENGHTSEPLVAEMFPPVPPRRDIESVVEVLQESLEKYGVPKKSAAEDLQSVPDRFTSALEGIEGAAEGATLKLTEQRKRSILAVLFGVSVQQDDPEAPVSAEAFKRALDAEPTISVENNHIDTLIQRANSRELIDVSPDGSTVEITDDGAAKLWDSGQSGNSGGIGHQAPMQYIARGLSEVGFTTRVPRQTGEEMPDLYATLPVETGGATFEEAKAARDELKEECPVVWALAKERDVAVEFEKATLSAPSQIGHNLRKAVTEDDPDHVLFVVNEDEDRFADLARSLSDKLADPMLTYADSRTPNDVYRRFHHQDDKLTAGDDGPYVAVRGEGTSYQWVDDSAPGDSPSIVLRVSTDDGYEELARFDSLEAWQNRSYNDFDITYAVNDGQVDVADGDIMPYASEEKMREDYTTVYEPFIPETQFGGDLPDSDAWDIAVLPNDRDMPLQYYDPDEDTCYPLESLADDDPLRSQSEPDDTQDTDESEDIWDDDLFK